MSLVFRYRARNASFDVDLGTKVVRLGRVALSMSAFMGDIGSCELAFDDVNGDIGNSGDQIKGFQKLTVTETDAPSDNQIIFDGFTQERAYESDESLVTGEQVRITTQLSDLNHLASLYVIRDDDANRPAESVGVRLTALLAFDGTPFHDNGFVDYPTKLMDKNNYINQTRAGMLDDLAEAAGFSWSLYTDEASGEISLRFYNPNTSTLDTSDLRISNVRADKDSNIDDGPGATQTWAPKGKSRLTRSPQTIASGVVIPFASSTEYVTRAATLAEFGRVDITAADSNVKSAAVATSRANRLLWENHTEADTITCSVDLPRANVNDIREGQRMEAKFRQFPGYKSGFTWFRVLKRTVKQEQQTDQFYTVELELSPQEAAEPTSAIVQTATGHANIAGVTLTFPNPVTIGDVLVVMINTRDGQLPPLPNTGPSLPHWGLGAWTDVTPNSGNYVRSLKGDGVTIAGRIAVYAKVADATDQSCWVPARYSTMAAWEVSGSSVPSVPTTYVDEPAAATTLAAGSLGSPASGKVALGIWSIVANLETVTVSPGDWTRDIYRDSTDGWGSFSGNSGSGAYPYTWIGHSICDGTALAGTIVSSLSRRWAGVVLLMP